MVWLLEVIMSKWLIVLMSLWAIACQEKTDTTEPRPVSPQATDQAPNVSLLFEGVVYPRQATKLRAPQNTFRIGGWQSDSSWIKLKKLTKDGKKVKKGDVVGVFEFRGQRALPRVKERIQRAQARQENASLGEDSTMRTMKKTLSDRKLNAKLSELDTRKKGIVAERDLKRFRLTHKLDDFEVDAQSKRLGAYRRSAQAERKYHERAVANAKGLMTRYSMYESRYKVKAPHDGIVRHGYHRRRRRKVQKGDGMPSGMVFMSIAKDKSLMLKFYVPEHRYERIRGKKHFKMRVPSSDKIYNVTLERLEEFPQELGFLKDDYELSNAREKVFVVHARFEQQPENLNAGVDVEVMLR